MFQLEMLTYRVGVPIFGNSTSVYIAVFSSSLISSFSFVDFPLSITLAGGVPIDCSCFPLSSLVVALSIGRGSVTAFGGDGGGCRRSLVVFVVEGGSCVFTLTSTTHQH